MVDRLTEQLRSDDAGTRRAAAAALGRIGDARAVEPLIALLDHDDRQLLVAAAGALARIGDRRAFEPLVRLLGDARSRGPAGGDRRAELDRPSGDERAYPARCSGTATRASVSPRSKIAGYFGYAECAGALLDRCRDTDETVRAAALEHVAYLDDDRSVPILIAALATDTPRARAAAAQALAHAGGAGAIEALRHGDRPTPIRGSAISPSPAWAASTTARRCRASSGWRAEDGAQPVRIAAIGAIGEIGIASDAAAVPMLATMCEAADDELAVAAAARARRRSRRAPALEALRRAMSARAAGAPHRRGGGAGAPRRAGGDRTAAVDGGRRHGSVRGAGRNRRARPDRRGATPHAAAGRGGDRRDRRAIRRAAPRSIAALARIPEAAIPHARRRAAVARASVRRAVIEALGAGRIRPPRAYVLTALDDDDASVRQLAVTVLSRLGTRGVARPFADLAAARSVGRRPPRRGDRVAAHRERGRVMHAPPDGR